MPEKPTQNIPILTREALLKGDLAHLVDDEHAQRERMSEAQREDLIAGTLNELGDNDLWIFGYGSLIWNPAIDFEEQRRCIIRGYKKEFCFWTTLSRGCPETPGLMMGLIEGEQCNGVAFRIKPEKAATELDILFRREMSHFIYKPTWVDCYCTESNSDFSALTFVVDCENHRYVENLSVVEIVRTIATAKGPLGRNCDYLFQLSEKLQELGFDEPELEELARNVRKYQLNTNI